MRTGPLIMAVVTAFGAATACSDRTVKHRPEAPAPQVVIAYATKGKITVVRPGKPEIIYANSAVGQSTQGPESAGGLLWSRNGRYVAWASTHPNLVAIADVDTGRVKTWPCHCTQGAFVGDRLVALDSESRTLLHFAPDARPARRVEIRGPFAEATVLSVEVTGSDETSVLVKTEAAGAKNWHLFRVGADGASKRIKASLPPRHTGWFTSRPDGRASFGLSTNGAGCGLSDQVAIVSTGGAPARVLDLPWSPTRWNVLRPSWGADGRLYVAATKWPPCSGNPASVTDHGEVFVLDGSTWQRTGLRMLSFQPVSQNTAVGLRGTQKLTSGSVDTTNELVVTRPGHAARVIARMVSEYAVSPRSISSFTGRHALLPAKPPAPASKPPTPVLGVKQDAYQEGFGHVRPGRVYLGGVSTGLIKDVKWHSWGGKTATADATGFFVGPGQITAEAAAEPAKVVAFKPGYCKGTYAYRALSWYFPGRGESFGEDDAMDICEWD